ncbi:hypothetical protein F4824DRAFT_506321 [Ustulina deusta]|nr:hypothetical protein F4824DRAFT_506321 [Ustulina deusta]
MSLIIWTISSRQMKRKKNTEEHRLTAPRPSFQSSIGVPWVAFQERTEMMNEADRFAIDALRKTPRKTVVRGQLPLPERIRINSKAILKILSKIHKEDLSSDLAPVLMMQPFRALAPYRDEIWKWKARLEARFGELRKTVPKSETNKVTEGDTDGDNDQVNIYEDDEDIDKDNNEETSKATSEDTAEEADEEADEGFDEEIDNAIDEDPHANHRNALNDLNCLI